MIDEILSNVYSYENLISAKERREKIRESMKGDSTGWGYICYGNCGNINFIEDRSKISNRDEYDKIVNPDKEFR